MRYINRLFTYILTYLLTIEANNRTKNQKWSGIRIRTFRLILIRMGMSAGSLSKCCGYRQVS